MKYDFIDVSEEFIAKSTPRQGRIIIENDLDISRHKNEIEVAYWLFDKFGGEITVLQESNEYCIKRPDYKWNYKYWELKHLKTRQSIDEGIKKAYKQIKQNPGGIIIDIKGCKEYGMIIGTIVHRLSRSRINVLHVIIKNNNDLIGIYEYKKRS